MNGAWLVLGINDMTRDTPLLEFSQVRATPIDGTPLPLCLPSKLNESFSFSPSFCCSFNLSKKERWTQKSLLGGIWRWARGKKGVPDRRGEEQRSLLSVRLNAWGGWKWTASSGRSLAVLPPRSGTWRAAVLNSLQHYLGCRPVLRPLSYRLNPSGFSEGLP